MRHARWFAVALMLTGARLAQAGALERIRQQGVLTCGAEPRASVAEDAGDGMPGGAAVDACRAVAAAVLGRRGRIAFRLYDGSGPSPDTGVDDLAFLTPAAVAEQARLARVVAGPVVFVVRLALVVPADSRIGTPAELAGRPICFMTASDAQAALDATFRARSQSFLHMAYQEEAEMADAYAARRCAAMAGEAGELLRLVDEEGTLRIPSRLLPRTLGTLPIMVATQPDADDLRRVLAGLRPGMRGRATPPASPRP